MNEIYKFSKIRFILFVLEVKSFISNIFAFSLLLINVIRTSGIASYISFVI